MSTASYLRMKDAVDEDIRRSNPKYPTLVGYKMAMLWNNIKMDRSRLAHEQKALSKYKMELRRFREQWGNRVPRTDAEWRDFWLGFKRLEDLVEDVQNGLSEIREDLHSTCVQGLEIVEQNGVDVMMEASDPVKEMEELLDRARSMSDNST